MARDDDPRRPDRLVDFKFRPPPKEELPFDTNAFLGLWFALGAVLLHVRVYSWLNLLMLMASLATTPFSAMEGKLVVSQVVMAGLTFVSTHSYSGSGFFAPMIQAKARQVVDTVV